jgi:uncharacterized membrane protein YeaQ/YmgE (transglycosylase-associated protein family)
MLVESLAIFLVAGLLAGWLGGVLLEDIGFGLAGDLVFGVLGAFLGGWLLPKLGVQLAGGISSAIITGTLGAVALLSLVRLVRDGGFWRGGPSPDL